MPKLTDQQIAKVVEAYRILKYYPMGQEPTAEKAIIAAVQTLGDALRQAGILEPNE